MTKQILTQERLKFLFTYNSETGVFIRNVNKARMKKGDVVGTIHNKGYLKASVDGKEYLLHRLAWLYVYGCLPSDQIDHIDHDKKNNAICNLRECSNEDNHMNMPKGTDNTSGFVGVRFNESNGKWRSVITANKKTHHLGYFDELSDAILARKEAEKYHGFHCNHGV